MSWKPSQRVADLERTLIRQIFDSAPPDAINLGLGQPNLPSPPSVSLAGIAGIARGQTGYSPTAGEPALREAIASGYPGFGDGADGILVTMGSQEAMFLVAMALTDPGDELLYPDPGYPGYAKVAHLVGARGVPYRLHAKDRFRLDPASIESRLSDRTRMVIVCEPSNPTGAISERERLEAVAGLLRDRGIPWVSDEIYAGFTYGAPFVSLAEVAPRGGLVVSGLSKDMSMTGWRVGWVAGPAPLVRRMTAAHQYLATCSSRISQNAALAAYSAEGQEDRRRFVARFSRRRELMGDELRRVPGLIVEPPDGAFYYFADASRHGDSLALARRILERQGVVVIPGEAFGEGAAGYLRLSFSASEEDIVEGVRRIARELETGAGAG